MNERTFFNLSAITNRVQEILQPSIGKLFWVKAEISSGRERGGSFYCDLVETIINNNLERQTGFTKNYMSSCSRRINEIRNYLKESETRFKSTWTYRILIEEKYCTNAKKGIHQGTRKLMDSTKANLKSLANLLSSRVFDRLSIEKSKLRVSENTIKTGAMNEINTPGSVW